MMEKQWLDEVLSLPRLTVAVAGAHDWQY